MGISELTHKTIFLIALATARRRSEIGALARSSCKFRVDAQSMTLTPKVGFLLKNQSTRGTQADRMKDILIPSLEALCGPDLPDDALNCPVRALRLYLKRTDPYRGYRDRLFLPIRPGQKGDISPVTISYWLKACIKECYASANKRLDSSNPVRGHQVRGVAASWAAKYGVSIDQLMNACYWKSHTTFSSHYLKDVWTNTEGIYFMGPLLAAQAVIRPGQS